ncbi:ATP-binding protein [Streptomyces sp. ME18-1-4]|uniref:ATP-binding protein n=1 Tax=Streptomyces sp. ME18-1-4 TaxID=3028685 RepID=UPI0029B5E835|nr:ATP-binding protein [Streptomyces sp. ME18-1-4]MDX3248483.1 ATP-binding protein [Streptomyces sp. ME18-1-4]
MIQETVSSEPQPGDHFRNFSVRLSPTPRGARLARLLAVEQLRSWELPLDPARQIVAELAANAATHARVPGRDFRLSLYVIANTLRIEVTDASGDRSPRPRQTAPEADAESGRGLLLVEALADRWGWAPEMRPRKTVWAEVALPPEPDASCFGAAGGFFRTRTEVKEPHQAPPLPPAAQTHSRE